MHPHRSFVELRPGYWTWWPLSPILTSLFWHLSDRRCRDRAFELGSIECRSSHKQHFPYMVDWKIVLFSDCGIFTSSVRLIMSDRWIPWMYSNLASKTSPSRYASPSDWLQRNYESLCTPSMLVFCERFFVLYCLDVLANQRPRMEDDHPVPSQRRTLWLGI